MRCSQIAFTVMLLAAVVSARPASEDYHQRRDDALNLSNGKLAQAQNLAFIALAAGTTCNGYEWVCRGTQSLALCANGTLYTATTCSDGQQCYAVPLLNGEFGTTCVPHPPHETGLT